MAPPRTVIVTPTTNLSIADLASCTNRPEKCIAIAVAPTDLKAGVGPSITLRAGPAASEETVALVCDFLEKLGFRPVVERSQ
jgi:3-hydroxybutyryl-CoA dehydrogenase